MVIELFISREVNGDIDPVLSGEVVMFCELLSWLRGTLVCTLMNLIKGTQFGTVIFVLFDTMGFFW